MEACVLTGAGHGVDISDHLLAGSDLRCWQPFGVCGEVLSPPVYGIGIAFKQSCDAETHPETPPAQTVAG